MSSSADKFWFPAKKYGWGWGLPCVWQGWLVFVVYLVLLAEGFFYFELPADTAKLVLYVISISAILVAICWAKGERPRWRWGK